MLEHYLAIAKYRFGDRLVYEQQVDPDVLQAEVPFLLLQPLVENAIYHGIELLPDGGDVTVTGARDSKYLTLAVSNPVAPGKARDKEGNKMALANIRQRFELAYGSRAQVDVDNSENTYRVTLRFPVDEDE